MSTLFEEARQHRLRDWGARVLGLRYQPGHTDWYGGAVFEALDATGKAVRLFVDYRNETVLVCDGTDRAAVKIHRP